MAFLLVFVLILTIIAGTIARQNSEASEWKPKIEPLNDFDWRATPPMKLRPFKPTYHITMAIQNSTPSDLIVMDNNYLERVTTRRNIMAEYTSAVYGTVSSGHAPVKELYTYLLGTYLPARYPTMFGLTQVETATHSTSQTLFRNIVTGRTYPLSPPPPDPSEMLKILGETVEDDLFLLLQDRDSGEHRAVAFVCCHPAGFDPSEKLGKRLAEIHGPVPAYEKIGASMERYFARLEVGRSVKRTNWSIQTHPNLYAPSGNHVHVGEKVEEEQEIDVEKARFRTELQTLTRLSRTQAILFSFKTYMYTLGEIKREGLGPDLADAVEGLKAGNAPGMWVYKGGKVNMAAALRNVVVVGGSYVGVPRFAISPGHEHKAFIPLSAVFAGAPDAPRHQVARARAVSLQPHTLTLDREWQGSRTIPFDFLVVATGTRLAAPGTMPDDDKPPSVRYLQTYQSGIKSARSVVIIGGGAVGVQMACDLKELYPAKEVTLVHSRAHLMPVYHEGLSNLIKARFAELGVKLVTGSRVVVPPGGFPNNSNGGKPFDIQLQDGRTLSAEFAIQATGQTPNNQFLEGLENESSSSLSESVVNPRNGFVRVLPTMQFRDPRYPHLFAVGDIADSGAHKAARPGAVQAAVAARNIAALVVGGEPTERLSVAPAGIHLTLGLTRNVIFRNPNTAAGDTEPFVNLKDDGREDMGIEGVWVRRGVVVTSPQEYHL
ncbi:putative FAD binding protein [Parachaetomium inaequale]|uniref:FAD binding protein n=1 Tax=Parachaetomium inaequale TaxID=2588326 RepID=A0AAN6SQ54_9PEZI|nr:putative FAD binding protein [Parachaetomium inaequale]